MARRNDDDDRPREVHVYHHSSKKKEPGILATLFGCFMLVVFAAVALVVLALAVAFWPRGTDPAAPGQQPPAVKQ